MAKKLRDTDLDAEKPQDTEKDTKPQRYIVIAGNREYSGKTCGLKFETGRALLDPGAIDPRLGWTFEQVVLEFEGLPGYELLPVPDGADLWALLRGVDMSNPAVAAEMAINEQAARNTAERRRLLGAT